MAFEFAEVNILSDAALYERYQHDIPVIHLDGREIARHTISPKQLQDAMGK